MVNKKPEFKSIVTIATILSLIALFSTIAFSIPNSLTLQGKLTNLGGTSQVGTFNFTFKIYDNVTAGNELWASVNQSVSTDSNGIYDVILAGLNLSFAEQYYLGISVQGENESSPRINLTSAPYSFRANTSEALNPNASYFVRNLSVSGHATVGNGTSTLEISTQAFNLTTNGTLKLAQNITLGDNLIFRFGQVIDNLVNGWLRVAGALNVTNGLIVGQGANISNGLNVISGNVGIGTTSPTATLSVIGSVIVSGSLNASSINATNITALAYDIGWTNLSNYPSACASGQFVTTVGDTITCATPSPSSGGGWTDDGALIRLATFSDSVSIGSNLSGEKLILNGSFRVDNSTTAVFFVNASAQRVGIGLILPNDALEVVGNVRVSGSINATNLNTTGQTILASSSGNVGIGTTAPGQALHVVGSTNVSATINAPVINTTLATQNLTISSAAGSVIIRLG